MRKTFPSVVVKYIDLKLPDVKRHQENKNVSCFMTIERSPIVVNVLSMVDAIPEHLITLDDLELAKYFEAVASLRNAVSIWNTGSKQHAIVAYQGSGGMNPFAIIRKYLETFNDEGVEPTINELTFIKEGVFRELLRRDFGMVSQSIDNYEWKAATVLGGSIIEAFLLYALNELNLKDSSKIESIVESLLESKIFTKKPPSDLNEWVLHQLTEVAAKASIINAVTADQCKVARNFRNLIHPGAEVRLAQECNRGTAFAVVAAIEFVIQDFT